MTPSTAGLGLDGLRQQLQTLGDHPVVVAEVGPILGVLPHAGSFRPLSSSAARLEVAGSSIWLPVPETPAIPDEGLAPFYRHADRLFVLPTVRLLVSQDVPQEGAADSWRFFSLDAWLLHAFTEWTFPLSEVASCSLSDRLGGLAGSKEVSLAEQLAAVALLVRYALFGSDRPCRLLGLRLPRCPMWLRPVTAELEGLALRSARSLVISARMPAPQKDGNRPRVPTTDLRAERYRMRPTGADWGLDPVHTPEGADIRLTGRLGVEVGITDNGELYWQREDAPRSPATSRVPYAGYDDPRRLLMAANMQTHAIGVIQQSEPLVRVDQDGLDPPGVNLRVGYLAWRGLNHEDAWVLSAAAAARLAAVQGTVVTVAIGALELPPRLLVEPGMEVRNGQLLLQRQIAPSFLTASLPVLACLPDIGASDPDTGGAVALTAEPGDVAPFAGTVTAVEHSTDFAQSNPSLAGWYRNVYRFHLRRSLPLQVGDKLANRHGHKGVVGAILPDEAMPCWAGKPLDALIDPISVLNRTNWGQLCETLAGGVAERRGQPWFEAEGRSREQILSQAREVIGCDEYGRSEVTPPGNGEWLREGVRAVAGVQFILRLPHHAGDRLSGGHAVDPAVRVRAQRFGEMDSWAAWAHGACVAMPASAPAAGAIPRLGRMLRSAGYDLTTTEEGWSIAALGLAEEPPAGALKIDPTKGVRAEAFDSLEQAVSSSETVLLFDPPVSGVWPPDVNKPPEEGNGLFLRWLPVLSAADRPPRPLLDGTEEPHELTRLLRDIVRAARQRTTAEEGSTDTGLQGAIHRLMRTALAEAVGLRATGERGSKSSWLRRGVLGRRVRSSGRATVTPGGPLELDLDEVGVPAALARSLLGPETPSDEASLREAVEGRRVWLKRDPVLHRWGLLPVRLRLVEGATVRLPASLLGPLGADFDGDTVALFADLPAGLPTPPGLSLAALARHTLLGDALFVPGKQYVYGLHLLAGDPARRQRLQEELAQMNAPAWPEAQTGKAALEAWVVSAAGSADPRTCWWAIVERHALAALASEPGMGLGLMDADRLAALPVVTCGAAKSFYRQDDPSRPLVERVLRGESLSLYRRSAEMDDPIASVMVEGKLAVGRFGGALRRLLYTADPLRPETVQAAQALTERITQKALSVKAGQPPLRYADFERQLSLLLGGEKWDLAAAPVELREALRPFERVEEMLRPLMARTPAAWLAWLRNPHLLPDIVRAAPGGVLRLPADDLRLACWRAAGGGGGT